MGEPNKVGDLINFNILVVILYFGYIRCYHWGKPSEEHRGSFHIISPNCTRICNDLTKSLILKKSRGDSFAVDAEKAVCDSAVWWPVASLKPYRHAVTFSGLTFALLCRRVIEKVSPPQH